MRVSLTQDDIDLGHKFQPELCPVGRALQRATGKFVRAGICWATVYNSREDWLDGKPGRDVVLPPKVRSFIIDYDNLGRNHPNVVPFEFEFDFPEQQESEALCAST